MKDKKTIKKLYNLMQDELSLTIAKTNKYKKIYSNVISQKNY